MGIQVESSVNYNSTACGMQKSRSSSSVVQSVSKRLWRTRSRSSSRATAVWTPQGSCQWADGAGRCVRLVDTSLLTLSEVERRALQQAALARLQQINLGTSIKIPEENTSAQTTKPKRRAYLLKRKALTTSFFDQRGTKDSDKDKESTGAGSVFGVPLAQCVETERALRRQQHGGSRASIASLGAIERGDDSESYDSGDWCWAGLEEAGGGGPKVPGLVSACLAHLRRHGLRTVGLFRVSASKKRVRQLREDWERGEEAALDAAVCPHDVATLLKEFLRDLPDPLLCRDLYQAFLQTQKIRNRRLQWEALRLIVQLLPAAHRDTLNVLLSFLSQLSTHSADDHQDGNKMDAANLATIFAPNILHKNKANEAASMDQLAERTDVINVVRQLIERQTELWTLPAELLHEAYIHLAHTEPNHLDSLLLRRHECAAERLSTGTGDEQDPDSKRVWSREEFLHGGAATGGPDRDMPARRSEKTHARQRRTRETGSDSSGSLSWQSQPVVKVKHTSARIRNSDELVSSGVVCSGASERSWRSGPSAHDTNDSASDYNETLGLSDDDSCVITASLHIPAAFPAPPRPSGPAPRARARSTSTDESDAKRDSAVGSSSPASASCASSPPSSPPVSVRAVRVSVAGAAGAAGAAGGDPARADGRLDDRLGVVLGRLERNTSDARAMVLRHQDESSKRQTVTTVTRTRESAQPVPPPRRDQSGTLYKRGELISSARYPPT